MNFIKLTEKLPLAYHMTDDLPYFIVKFKIKCLTASWLSLAFTNTDLMLQFCLPDIK